MLVLVFIVGLVDVGRAFLGKILGKVYELMEGRKVIFKSLSGIIATASSSFANECH